AGLTMTELAPDTYYALRAVAVGPGGDTPGNETTFATLPPAPDGPGQPLFENVRCDSLEVPLPSLPAYAYRLTLQQKPAGAGGSWTEAASFDSGYFYEGMRAYVYGLQPDTAYLFRWVALGYGGSTAGAPNVVTTSPAPP